MNEFWFRPRLTSYGATPETWEGYALIGILIIVIVVCVVMMKRRTYVSIFPPPVRVIAVSTILFLIVCAWKTDGAWG